MPPIIVGSKTFGVKLVNYWTGDNFHSFGLKYARIFSLRILYIPFSVALKRTGFGRQDIFLNAIFGII